MRRMLIVENEGFLRDLLTKYFNNTKTYKVVSSLSDGTKVLEECFNKEVDVALMDICTDDDSHGGIKAAEKIKRKYPHIKVILMTRVPETNYIHYAKEIGVDSFLYKTEPIEVLHSSIDKTMEGKKVWPKVNCNNLRFFDFKLSTREEEVARLICCDCLTREEIAKKLGIQPGTVKTITSRILVKTQVKNIRELMTLMLSNEYFKPENENSFDS